MKRSYKLSFILCMVLIMFSINTFAQTKSAKVKAAGKDSALLYEISGKGLEKPSYLFGTFHIICSGDMIQMNNLTSYVDKTEQLYLEIDLDNQTEMMQMGKMAMLADGKTLNDLYTKEEYAKVDGLIQNSMGISLENFKTYKPMFIGVMALTSPKNLGCSQANSYDMSFMQYAVSKQKPVEGLETMQLQIDTIDSIPLEKQLKDLYEMAVNPDKSTKEFKQMLEIYKTQDTGKLYEFMQTQMKDDAMFQTNFLDKRNTAWIPKIEKAIKEKPTFFAVGAGHLGGKTGVVNLLRKRGFKLKPIKIM